MYKRFLDGTIMIICAILILIDDYEGNVAYFLLGWGIGNIIMVIYLGIEEYIDVYKEEKSSHSSST